MTKRISNNELLAAIETLTQSVNTLNNRVTALESKDSKVSAKSSKKTKKASAPKKSAPKQTWEEHLTEKFGDKEERSKFVELRKQVAAEFLAIAKKEDKYIPKKSYQKILNDTTTSLNGKMNKSVVKKAFLAVAK